MFRHRTVGGAGASVAGHCSASMRPRVSGLRQGALSSVFLYPRGVELSKKTKRPCNPGFQRRHLAGSMYTDVSQRLAENEMVAAVGYGVFWMRRCRPIVSERPSRFSRCSCCCEHPVLTRASIIYPSRTPQRHGLWPFPHALGMSRSLPSPADVARGMHVPCHQHMNPMYRSACYKGVRRFIPGKHPLT